MYRVPIVASSSKLLQERWDRQLYYSHRNNIKSATSLIDNEAPNVHIPSYCKMNKLPVEEAHQLAIERGNHRLLQHITHIMCGDGRIDNKGIEGVRSLNHTNRLRQLVRITYENQGILKRILGTKSVYDREKFERDWLKHKQYMEHMSMYPQIKTKPKRKLRSSSCPGAF